MTDTATQPSPAQSEREADIARLNDTIREMRYQEKVKRATADAFAEEVKGAGLNPVTGLSSEDKDAFDRIDKAYKEADEYASQASELEHRLQRLVVSAGHEADERSKGDLDNPDMRRVMSLADRFLASENYKQFRRSRALDMAGARVRIDPVSVASREATMAMVFPSQVQQAAISIDALIPDDTRLFPPIPFPVRQLKVRDLVAVGTTDTDTIEYVEETTRTDVAAETPYGSLAPEATYEYTLRTSSVKRIPQYVKATKGQLADAGQLRTLLDNRLVYGVGKRLDTQMINGDASGDNLRGIMNAVGLQEVNTAGLSVPDAFHRGMTAVRLSLEDEPDAFLINPTTYQNFVLAKGTDNHYLNLQGPQMTTPPNIWGKPAVISTVIPATSALVGNWKMGATLWVRSGIQVAATDSDDIDFRKGIITILAEMRAAFAVTQVKAFAEITGVALS
jgi:HK97 family phage major capsid protein